MNRTRARHGVFLIIAILLAGLAVEGASYLVLRILNPNAGGPRRTNLELSGYTVFKNTPNFVYGTYAPGQQPPVRTDDFGFISDEVITVAKPPDTVRVFLLGGSAMAGAGQLNDCYGRIREFPRAIYAYEISIAGALKAYLQEQFPGKKIQVINAATYVFQLHQSMVLYLEKVSAFDPDLVINMDGFNDLGSIATGFVWQFQERVQLDGFVEARVQREAPVKRFQWSRLIDYVYARYLSDKIQPPLCVQDDFPYTQQAYVRAKPDLQQSSQGFLTGLRQYMNILKGDGVPFVFVLQPMITRGRNKELADYERRMRDELTFGAGVPTPPRLLELIEDPTEMTVRFRLAERFFVDDYLADAIKSSVESHGFVFADMGAEIADVGKDVEFYSDYVHLTTDGNRIVARKIGDLIVNNALLR